jgi:hypothetical protein
MKRAMVGILAVMLLAVFASPVMARSPYSADVKKWDSSDLDCGNVVVTWGGTLIAFIDLGGSNSACAWNTTTTLEVCAVLGTGRTLIDTVSDNNPTDQRIGVLEGTKINTFESGQAFDFLEFRAPNSVDCDGNLEYTSGQPR